MSPTFSNRNVVLILLSIAILSCDVINALSTISIPVSSSSTSSATVSHSTAHHSSGYSVRSSSTSTRLEYKFSDGSDDGYESSWYPIPLGQIKLLPKRNLPADDTAADSIRTSPVIIGKMDNLSSRDRSKYYYHRDHMYDDSSYYPIPVDGIVQENESSSTVIAPAASTTSTGSAPATIVKLPAIIPNPSTTTTTTLPDRKPVWTQINGFQELCNYLEDDERLTVVKFYAPWCKSCRKLSLNLKKAACDYGDIVVNRMKVNGVVRFSRVEYKNSLQYFISNIMQIKGIPTVQLYYKTYKIYDMTGITTTKELVEQINLWLSMTKEERLQYATDMDDGVLQNAIENHFYDDYPDFLEEEW